MTKSIVLKCNLCPNTHVDGRVVGFTHDEKSGDLHMVSNDEAEDHLCIVCIVAIGNMHAAGAFDLREKSGE